MKFRQEITNWVDAPSTPNHIYITKGNVLLGYVKSGTTKPFFFSKPPKQWSPRGRKFRDLTNKELSLIDMSEVL